MAFVGEGQSSEQRLVIMLAKTGVSRKGATVNLENPRLTNDDTANDAVNVITPHESGDPFQFQINSSVDASANPVAFAVTATYDGQPGSGVKDLTDPGMITWISPSAASAGPVVASAEDVA